MKIGVIGPETTVKVIKDVAERDTTDVQFVYCCTEFYEESGEVADRLQRQKDVDAILFSCPTNYAYARHRVKPAIPLGISASQPNGCAAVVFAGHCCLWQ